MQTLNKDYILTMLSEEKLWKTGESNVFIYGDWIITIRKEEEIYKPFRYSISAEKINTNQSWNRRYTTLQQALLHIFNNFNENANINNKYKTLSDVLNTL